MPPHFHSSPLEGGEGHHLSQRLLDLPPQEVRGSITALQLAHVTGTEAVLRGAGQRLKLLQVLCVNVVEGKCQRKAANIEE